MSPVAMGSQGVSPGSGSTTGAVNWRVGKSLRWLESRQMGASKS